MRRSTPSSLRERHLGVCIMLGFSLPISSVAAQELRDHKPVNTKELFVQIVCAGRPEKGMPSWCALGVEIPTIEKMYAYVKGRSDARIGPGRSAVKPGT